MRLTHTRVGLYIVILGAFLFCTSHLWSQTTAGAPPADAKAQSGQKDEQPIIQDNSFLVEEAYNQEYGVVQHIQSFQRFWESHAWGYSFTQEWPVDPAPKHQLSYTITSLDAKDGSGAGFGDLALNYRYQLVGNGDSKLAFAPRFTLLVPTGDYKAGHGAGAVGYQGMLPVSWVHNKRFSTHWNLGTTITPGQKDPLGQKATTFGVNAGQSVIFNVSHRVNLMLESVWYSTESVLAKNKTERDHSFFMSPGVRWAYNLKSGMQIVPGVAFPIGVGPSRGDNGLFLYFSIEHPFTRKKTN